MEKLKLHSKDLTAENIEKLAALFPNCLTEAKAGDGTLKHAIDFDLLRQELSADLVEGPQERYRLDWPGKREALATANAPIAKTLRPCRGESVDFDATKNLYIEADNLEALKLLQETYLGKVKMIYIDPPYNTGNDFIYDDDFREDSDEYFERSNQADSEGNRLIANSESNGRFHSDWLSLMFSRLKIARNLLREDGVIFISIDDHELANLQKLCGEVMGADSIIGTISNKRRQVADNRNIHRLSTDHEYILVCAKSQFRMMGTEKDLSKYSNPDKDSRGAWMSDNMTGLANKEARPNLHYDIVNPETNISYPPHSSRGWAYERSRVATLIQEKRILWPRKPDGRPRIKRFVDELKDTVTGFSTVQKLGYTTEGTREMTELMGKKVFDFPKPVGMLRRLCVQAVTRDEDLILDFFSGSGTTAHAVMQLNADDGGNRRHIMVQLPEACDEKSTAFKAGYTTIAEIGKERIRRAGAKIRAGLEAQLKGELPGSDIHQEITAKLANLDTGFRVLKVDTSNMADVFYRPDEITQDGLDIQVENIKPDRSPEDLLFQVLLDWGVDLASPIRKDEVRIMNDEAEKIYTVFTLGENDLVACFDTGVTENLIKEIAKSAPLRVVFRDASFKNDATKINIEQIFKALSPHTELKAI